MTQIQIEPIGENDKAWGTSIIKKQWGSTNTISRGKPYQANRLPGYIAFISNNKVGLITYHLNHDCEIVTLDSLIQGKGVGIERIGKKYEVKNHNKLDLI